MLRGIGREVALVALARAIWGLADGVLAVIVPLYLVELGADVAGVGAVLGTGATIGALLIIPAAVAAERIGRRPVLVASTLAPLIGTIAYLPLAGWRQAYAVSAVYWSGVAALPLLNAHVASHQRGATLGRAMGFTYGISMVGLIAAPPLAGGVAAAFGLRAAIGVAAVAYLGFVAAVVSLRAGDTAAPGPVAPRGALPRVLLPILPAIFLATGAFYLPIVLLPLYLRDAVGVPLATVGVLIALMNLGGALLSGGAGYFADRLGQFRSLVGAAALLGAGSILVALGQPFLIPVGMVLLGAQVGANPVLASLIGRLLSGGRHSLAYTLLQLATRLGMAAAAVCAGLLYAVDPRVPLIASAALALPAGAAVILAARSSGSAAHRDRPPEQVVVGGPILTTDDAPNVITPREPLRAERPEADDPRRT